jgi:hypothetical protein
MGCLKFYGVLYGLITPLFHLAKNLRQVLNLKEHSPLNNNALHFMPDPFCFSLSKLKVCYAIAGEINLLILRVRLCKKKLMLGTKS